MSAASWPWAELELEATPDRVAIKKAYAKKLKVTRPDDNPAGYQRLRAAYEAALHFAQHWHADEDDAQLAAAAPTQWVAEESELPAAPAAAVVDTARGMSVPAAEPEAAPHDDAPQAAPTERVVDVARRMSVPAAEMEAAPHDDAPQAAPTDLEAEAPQRAVQRVRAFIEEPPLRLGAEAAQDYWRQLRAALDALPLQWHSEASLRCAEVVIQAPGLSSLLAIELNRYFGWTEDFRQAHALGPQGLEQLRAALASHAGVAAMLGTQAGGARSPYSYHDDGRRALLFAALLQQAHGALAFFFAMLASPRLAGLWRQFVAGERRMWGVDAPTLARGERLMSWAFIVRATWVVLPCYVPLLLRKDNALAFSVTMAVVSGLAGSFFLLFVVRVYDALIAVLRKDIEPWLARFNALKLANYRFIAALLAAAVAFIAYSTRNLNAGFAEWAVVPATLLAIVAGAVLLVSGQVWSVLLPALVFVGALECTMLFDWSLRDAGPWLAGFLLAAGAQFVCERYEAVAHGYYERPWRFFGMWLASIPWWAWIGFKVILPMLAAVAYLSAPVFALVAAQRESRYFALAAVFAALLLKVMFEGFSVVILLTLAVFALRLVQRAADWLAQQAGGALVRRHARRQELPI